MIRVAVKWHFQYIERLIGVSPFKMGGIIYCFIYLTRKFLAPTRFGSAFRINLGQQDPNSFLKKIICKTALWATSGVGKRYNSAKIFFKVLENWIISQIKSYFILFFLGIFSILQGVFNDDDDDGDDDGNDDELFLWYG